MKRKKLLQQMMKFMIVGGISFVVDYGVMLLLKEGFGVHYLLASTSSFLISLVVNYRLSMRYVFQGKEDLNRRTEFFLFLLLSAIGCGVNQLVMFIGTDLFGIYYQLTKLGATAIVMVWNFVSRKIFLEKKEEVGE